MWKDLTTYCLRHLRSDLIKVSEIWSPTFVLSLQDSSVGGTREVMGYQNAPCGVLDEPIQNEKRKKNKNKKQLQLLIWLWVTDLALTLSLTLSYEISSNF